MIDDLKKQVSEEFERKYGHHGISYSLRKLIHYFLSFWLEKTYNQGFEDGVRKTVEEVGKVIPCKKSIGNTTLCNPTFPHAERDYFNAYNQAINDIINNWQQLKDKLLKK